MANGSKHRRLIRKAPQGILHLLRFGSTIFLFARKQRRTKFMGRLLLFMKGYWLFIDEGHEKHEPVVPPVFSQVSAYANPSIFLQRLADTTVLLCPLDLALAIGE